MGSTGKSLREVLSEPGAADQMRKVENEISRTVKQFSSTTEAMIIIFALIRVACTLLNLYKPNTRKVIVEQVLAPKLYGDHREEGLLIQ